MTHAPAPWTVDPEMIVRDAKGNEVATLALGAQLFEGADNGALIAAAPALLEALEAITHAFWAVSDDESGVDDDPVFLNARAAIALAKGESK